MTQSPAMQRRAATGLGKLFDQIKQIIADVRHGWNNRYEAPNGETIYRQGD